MNVKYSLPIAFGVALFLVPTQAVAEPSQLTFDPGLTFSVRLFSGHDANRPRWWLGPSLSINVWPRAGDLGIPGTPLWGFYTSVEVAGDGSGGRFQAGLQGILAPGGIELGPEFSWDRQGSFVGGNAGLFASAGGFTWLGLRGIFDARGFELDLTGGVAYPITPSGSLFGGFGHGRPLREEGRAVIARSKVRSHQKSRSAVVDRAQGYRWLKDAEFEHASVAAFSLLSLQLLALGAPSGLVDGAHRAARQEVRHAKRSYALAARFLQAAIEPGPVPLRTLHFNATDQLLSQVMREAIVEGCFGEGMAAAIASAELTRVTDPMTKSLLCTIAKEEADHADLAWRVALWCRSLNEPLTQEAVSQALDDVEAIQVDVDMQKYVSRAEQLKIVGAQKRKVRQQFSTSS